MAIESPTNGTGSSKATAKNTTVIPSGQANGTYQVTHDGLTYNYIITRPGNNGGKWQPGGNVPRISWWVDPLEEVNNNGRLLLLSQDVDQINVWTPPASFFPPNVIVRTFQYDELRLDDGTLTRVSRDQTGWFTTPKKKKKKKKETPAMGNSPVMTLDDFGVGQFNPPPHKTSRTLPPTAFPNYSTTDTDNSIFTQLESANNRGYFYQDLESAITLQGKQKTKSQLWGFQFMYNPTTISYSNQANSSIDYGNLDDVANQLVGSQSISFEVLINRTADVSALKTTAIPGTADYPRALTSTEAINLRKRGTEYDVEFLYRCLNGDPQKTEAMLEETSDYGYLAGIPVWLKFNNNVRYKGVINSITVEHVMFSENMVPMISKVTLSFLRLPSPIIGTEADVKAFYEKQFSKVPNFSGAARTTAESE